MAANAEEFLLRLNQQISGPASVAAGALANLESQIRAEQSALVGLQAKAATAGQALGAQSAFVKDLQSQLGNSELSGKQFDALSAKVASASAKLRDLQKAKAAADGGVAAKESNIGKLQGALPELKVKADKGNAEAAAAALKKAGKEAEVASPSFKQLGAAAGETDGPLGNVVRTIGKFKAAGAAGAALAVVGVLIAIATAAIAGAIALTRFALAMADAARSSRLMSGAAAGSAKGGAELEAVIDDVATKSPLARDKIAEMARAMEVAHLQGRNMQNALEAATTAASAIGDSAASSFTSIAEASQKARRFLLSKQDLEGTGVAMADVAASIAEAMHVSISAATQMIQRGQVSVAKGLEAMNDAVQKKFGKTVAAQMLSLNTQIAKMKEGFGKLFDGIDIEPFLRGLKTITDLFSQTSVTGVALKTLFSSIFTPLAGASEGVFPLISAFMRGMIIAALRTYIVFLQLKSAIKEAFGGSNADSIDWVKTAMYAGMVAAIAFGAVLVAIAVIVAFLATAFLPLAVVLSLPFLVPLAIVGLFIYAIKRLVDSISSIQIPDLGIESTFKNALAFLGSISLADAGGLIMDSLANGIMSGLGRVVGAMKGVGKAILGALPAVLQMHSPSVLLTNQAKMAAGSVVTPLEDAKDDAHAAMADLGGGRPDFGGAGGVAPSGGKSGARSITIENLNFTGTRDDFDAFRKMFADLVEQLCAEAPEPAT